MAPSTVLKPLKTLVITGSESNFFGYASDCLRSLKAFKEQAQFDCAFLDIGCNKEELDQLDSLGVDHVRKVEWEFGIKNNAPHLEHMKGCICRPFIPHYFPGYDVYIWLDADTWLHDVSAIEALRYACLRRSAGIVMELSERSSRFVAGHLDKYTTWLGETYRALYGEGVSPLAANTPMCNAGVFAIHAQSRHWQVWRDSLKLILRAGLAEPRPDEFLRFLFFICDQLALNYAINTQDLLAETELLPSWCNWTCCQGLPVFNRDSRQLVEPYYPHHPIGVLHLNGGWVSPVGTTTESYRRFVGSLQLSTDSHVKHQFHKAALSTLDHDLVTADLRFSHFEESLELGAAEIDLSGQSLPDKDYVSPSLKIVLPDAAFPNKILGDTTISAWPYLRQNSPHNWYVDKRHPAIGFVSRDEASILYNYALMMKGKPALEIGCWMGWSACHLALGGVELDVIDPMLANAVLRESVDESLKSAGVRKNVRLYAATSPNMVHQLGRCGQHRWSLIFIDGDHEGSAPLNDTIAVLPYAADDCVVLFHDMLSPHVAAGLAHLQDAGWNTRLYNTSQAMAAAWRGNVQPLDHQADPLMPSTLPDFLSRFGF